MSTIVEFRRARNELAFAQLVPAEGKDLPARAVTSNASNHMAEIFLLPRTRRPEPGAGRKPMKRRFAVRAAAEAMATAPQP